MCSLILIVFQVHELQEMHKGTFCRLSEVSYYKGGTIVADFFFVDHHIVFLMSRRTLVVLHRLIN